MPRWLLALFGALPVVALLAHWAMPSGPIAGWLDAWFSFHCHQDPRRAVHVGGQAFPVCARCLGIYLGLLAGALVQGPAGTRRSWLTLLGLGVTVLLVDVGTQAAGLRVSSLTTRLVTGLLLAYPAARFATLGAPPLPATPPKG